MNGMILPAHVQRVLAKFKGVRPTRDGWDAHCPCPDHNQDGDQNPSLRITLGEDSRVLLKCRVGCPTDAVLDAIGLDWNDLFVTDKEEAIIEDKLAQTLVEEHPVDRLEKANANLCASAYQMLLDQLPLADEHRDDLRRRGFSDAEIDKRGYRSLRNVERGQVAKAVHKQLGDAVLGVPGFVQGPYGITLHGEATGLLVPVRDLQGRIVALKIRRPTEPKYVYVTSGDIGPSPGSPVHVPLGVTTPASVVRLTEGELKSDIAFVLDGTPTVGVPGVTQWRSALALLKELGVRTVILAYDAPDVLNKRPVFEQTESLYGELTRMGFVTELEVWGDG